MRHIKSFIFSLTAIFLLLCGCSGGKIEVQPKWTFAVLCDTRGDNVSTNRTKSGVNEAVVNSMARDIVKEGAELVIVPGDLVNGWFYIDTPYADQFATWRQVMAPVYDAGIKVYPVRGNHENGPPDPLKEFPWPPDPPNYPTILTIEVLKAAYLTAFADAWIPGNGPPDEEGLTYSFVYKNAFFVGLDHYINLNPYRVYRVNQPWLDDQFRQNKQPHTFVYGHAPAFRVGHADSLASYPEERDLFWNSLGNAGVRMYFSGHDHLYNRAHIDDQAGHTIYQVLAGSGGAPFNIWPHPPEGGYFEGDKVVHDYDDQVHYGYIIVTVDGPHVTMKWKAMLNNGVQDVWIAMDILEYTVN
jgi:3',5'-cyclic AMP phosphodiesterase CpdA